MFSKRTLTELIHVIDEFSHNEIDRIFHVFDITHYIIPPEPGLSKAKKSNYIFRELSTANKKGPHTELFTYDLLEYTLNAIYRNKRKTQPHWTNDDIDDCLVDTFPMFVNSLKKDGFIVKHGTIKKLLPEAIEEAKTENELVQFLEKFKFLIAKGHLEQAIDNYVSGNWAGANSQFRSFVESLLIELCKTLLPAHSCSTAAGAVKLLHKTLSPPFFSEDLNEVESPKCDKPFIEGLWKRLHPAGSHPGLSDEADCTFRYHITIVVAHYLLKRFESRI